MSLIAIQKSISKWERIKEAVERSNLEEARKILVRICPLCEEYCTVDCRACPIYKMTGAENCNNTPYYAIYSVLELGDRNAHGKPWLSHIKVRFQDRTKLIEELVNEMVGVLKSLFVAGTLPNK